MTAMDLQTFRDALEQRIGKYDLLCHPFYQAWTAGELTTEDLRVYAGQYYRQVSAFPTYLSALHARMEDGEARRTVLRNLADEEGIGAFEGRPHSEIWLDFAEGMGADRDEARSAEPLPEVREMVETFRRIARESDAESAMSAFYAYESQVPRVAETKESGLRAHYGADDRTCGYFTLHKTADVHHSRAWRQEVERALTGAPEQAEKALDAAEAGAQALWSALDGIERERLQRKGAAAA